MTTKSSLNRGTGLAIIVPIVLSVVIALTATFWPTAALLLTLAGLIALGGVLFVLKYSEAGIIIALTIAGLLSPLLRQLSIVDVGSGDVRLAGVVSLAVWALTATSILAAYFLQDKRLHLACRAEPILLLSTFIGFNVLAVLVGAIRFGAMNAINDAKWIPWIGFFLVIIMKPSVRLIRQLGVALLAITTLQSLQGVYRLVEGRGTIYLSTGGERYVAGSTSIWIASGFVVSMLMLIYVAKSRTHQYLFASMALLQAVGIIISFNRQTWLALVVSLSFGFLLFFRGRRLRLLLRVTGVSLVLVLVILFVDSLHILPIQIVDALVVRIGGGDLRTLEMDPSYQFRLSAWTVAITGALQNPLIGLGWGAPFEFSIIVPRTGVVQNFSSSPHNTYLWLAYKSGFPSMFSFLALMSVLIFQGARRVTFLMRSGSVLAVYLIGAILIELIFLTGAIFWDYLSVAYMSIPFWVNTGVIAALAAYSSPRSRTSETIRVGADG